VECVFFVGLLGGPGSEGNVDGPATGASVRLALAASFTGAGFVPNSRMPPQTTAITTTTASASDVSDRRG
jgi:hypothetical protein